VSGFEVVFPAANLTDGDSFDFTVFMTKICFTDQERRYQGTLLAVLEGDLCLHDQDQLFGSRYVYEPRASWSSSVVAENT